MNRMKKFIAPLLCVVLFALVFLLYLPVRNYEFLIYDDDEYVVKNSFISSGLTAETVKWAFTSFRCANWHPLTWISHSLDVSLFGMNPGGHHLMNVFFHASNTVLLFIFCMMIFKNIPEPALWSFIIAGIFGLHPQRLESVVWIAERKDLLCGLFWMLCLVFYVKYVFSGKRVYYVFLFVFMLMGVMSKPMIVTLPFVLLLLDYWPLGRMSPVSRMSDLSGSFLGVCV